MFRERNPASGHTIATGASLFRRIVRTPLLLLIIGVVVFQNSGQANSGTTVTDPLPYSLSYTITGNYVTSSVDFLPRSNSTGFQTEVIRVRDDAKPDKRLVPAGANVVAAFLYWETIWQNPGETVGAKFRGKDITLVRGVGTPLVGPYSRCWSDGGGTLTPMRADVLPLLALEPDNNGHPQRSSSGLSAQLTHIGASGAPNDTDRVLFNGTLLPNGTNRFVRTSGGSSDRAWSSPTLDVTSQMSGATYANDPGTTENDSEYGERVTTTITQLTEMRLALTAAPTRAALPRADPEARYQHPPAQRCVIDGHPVFTRQMLGRQRGSGTAFPRGSLEGRARSRRIACGS